MALVAAKCTQCGAALEVDNALEAGICRHCGTAYVTQKVINNYNISNNLNITTGGNVINIYKTESRKQKEISPEELAEKKKIIAEQEALIEKLTSKSYKLIAVFIICVALFGPLAIGIGGVLWKSGLLFQILCIFGIILVLAGCVAIAFATPMFIKAGHLSDKVQSIKNDIYGA
ncbi:MAG: hypothetical protein FWD58_10415 [Firmicutes bacterium]|nr:hypothetical protein [Bacillota bacterium]